jgi:hypothetical protein
MDQKGLVSKQSSKDITEIILIYHTILLMSCFVCNCQHYLLLPFHLYILQIFWYLNATILIEEIFCFNRVLCLPGRFQWNLNMISSYILLGIGRLVHMMNE